MSGPLADRVCDKCGNKFLPGQEVVLIDNGTVAEDGEYSSTSQFVDKVFHKDCYPQRDKKYVVVDDGNNWLAYGEFAGPDDALAGAKHAENYDPRLNVFVYEVSAEHEFAPEELPAPEEEEGGEHHG